MREKRTYKIKVDPEDVEIDWLKAKRMIEEGAILIDLRDEKDIEKDPIENAIKASVDDIFTYKLRFENDKTYILLDYLGVTSKIIAEYLRRKGIKAFAVKGGIRKIKEKG